MKQKLTAVLLSVLLVVLLLCPMTAQAAEGSLTASANASSVTVGQSVTVTLKYNGGGAGIGAIDAEFRYNASAFEYVSCTEAVGHGGAGVVRLSWACETAQAPTAVTVTLTLKAVAAGAGEFAVSTGGFINDADYSSLGTPGATVAVSAVNPTLSGNADLASLKPSSGTLTPAFKAATTKYTIAVPYTTSSLSLSATPAVSGAKVKVSGSNSLQVGENTQSVTVTAPNGTTKTYTVVITRGAQSDNAQNTTAVPAKELLEVEVGGVLMTVSDTQPEVTLPAGYSFTSIPFNGLEVSAAQNAQKTLTLLYLISATDQTGAFYIYDAAASAFTLFKPMTVAESVFALIDMPADMQAPAGTVAGEIVIAEHRLACWQYEDPALAAIVLVYAAGSDGQPMLYTYDTEDGSMQRYREVTVPVEAPPEEPESAGNAFVQFVTAYRQVILISAAALAGAALLIVAIVLLIILLRKPKNARH